MEREGGRKEERKENREGESMCYTHLKSPSKSSLKTSRVQLSYCTVTARLSKDHTSQSCPKDIFTVYCSHEIEDIRFKISFPFLEKFIRPVLSLKVAETLKILEE